MYAPNLYSQPQQICLSCSLSASTLPVHTFWLHTIPNPSLVVLNHNAFESGFLLFQSLHFRFRVSKCHTYIFNRLCKLWIAATLLKNEGLSPMLHINNKRDCVDHPGFLLEDYQSRFECYLKCTPPPPIIVCYFLLQRSRYFPGLFLRRVLQFIFYSCTCGLHQSKECFISINI